MQVGKTTAADHLVERHAFVKRAFADPIKRIACDAYGWDGAKDARGRRLLQEIGSVGRRYDPDLWLKRLSTRLASDGSPRVVVDDVRLAREVACLEGLGFACVRILRSPALISTRLADQAREQHETETELDAVHFAHTIRNDGSFTELYMALDDLVAGVDRSMSEEPEEIGGSEKPKGPAA